jgi:hypothetical protein
VVGRLEFFSNFFFFFFFLEMYLITLSRFFLLAVDCANLSDAAANGAFNCAAVATRKKKKKKKKKKKN